MWQANTRVAMLGSLSSIFVNHVQPVGIVWSFSIAWPLSIDYVLNIASLLGATGVVVSSSCALQMPNILQQFYLFCSALLPMGFTEPDQSPGLLVSSYLTVSPLPADRSLLAVYFLWHFP